MRIICEHSKIRTKWDFLILFFIIASVLLIPYQFAFQHKVTSPGSIIIYLIDLFFIVDVFFNFNTSLGKSEKKSFLLVKEGSKNIINDRGEKK